MAKRYFNWKLAIVLLMGAVVLGGTAVGLRRWQKSRGAENALLPGLEAYKQQRWEDAAQNLGRYLGVNRGDVDVLLKYANALLNIRPTKPNRVQQAVAVYREVLRIDKRNAEAAKKLTEVYLAIGSAGEAELIAKRQLEMGKDPELRRLLALALAGQRKFAEAAQELKNIISDEPNQVSAYETLGRLAEQRPADFAEPSAHWFDEAVKNNPSSALAYIIRAAHRLRSQNRAQAMADLEQAEKLDLSGPDVRLRLAVEFMNANILDKAEKHLAAAQAAKPRDVTLWQTWARLALASQSQTKMVEVAEAGLKDLSSYPWDFLPMAAELFIRTGQLDRASECLAKMRQKDLSPETVAFFEGLIAEQKQDVHEAVRCFRRSIELGNKFPQLRIALASGLSRLGDTQSALRELRGLVSDMPNLFAGRMALVRLLARTGNWPAVVEQARTAMQLAPQNLEAQMYYLRAQTYLLATQPAAQSAQIRKEIENRLAALEKATEGAADVKLLQFQLAMQQENLSRAQDLLTELKKEPATTPGIALAEAQLLTAQGKADEAISILKQAVKESADAMEPVTYLAVLLNQQKDREQCEAALKDALARTAEPAAQRDLGLLLAQFYTSWQEPDKTYELLTTLDAKLPNDIPLKRRLLASEQVMSDPAKAQQIVDNIKTLEGQAGWQWRYEQARIWLAAADFKQRYSQITSLLQENLLANPEDNASRTLLAGAYDRAGELRLAISTYREALNRSPNDLRIIIPFVAALYRAGENNQADQILQRASEQELYHPQLDLLRFGRQMRLGEIGAAADILERLLSDDPDNRAICLSLAGLKIQQNRFDEAEQLLDKLTVQEPNSLAVATLRVKLRILQGRPQEAIRICDEIISSIENASAYVLRARAYSELGDPNNAEKDLEHAGRMEPKNLEVWTAKSDFYGSRGQPDRAIDCLLQAMSIEPNNLPVQKRAIPLLLASGNRDRIQQGKTILDKALQASPADIDLRLFKANSLLAEGTAPATASAQQILQKITEERPEVSSAWALLGQIAMSQQEPAKALDAAMRGLVHSPNDRALLAVKADAEFARAPILAIPTLRTLHELEPNNVDTAVRLARTYMAAGQPENAVKLLEKQLPSCANTLEQRRVNTALAVALYESGDKEQAQKKLDFLIQSDPNDPGPLLAQVRLLSGDELWDDLSQKVTQWHQNHPQDVATLLTAAAYLAGIEDSRARETAEKVLRMTLQSNPDSQEAMVNLAILLYTSGQTAESAQLYQRALQIDPNNLVAINNFAWILSEEQNQFQQALVLVERGLKIAPQYVDLIDTRGMVYYRLGQFEKAIQDFNRCVELYRNSAPAKASSLFHLARALTKLGQTAKALEQLKQALDLHSQTGGLSPADLTEAQRLREQLEKGG
jgi:tetratricopeptide (TPR) repeat protein